MTIYKIRTAALCLLACASAFAADPKKVLVFSRCEGFNHRDSIALGNETIKAKAAEMNYTVDFTLDYEALKLENLKKYDALLLNNTTHMKTKANPFVEKALTDYVSGGGGLCLIHAALDNFYDAPSCAYMGGGQFDGHPWHAGGTWKFRIEDRTSPLTASFKADETGTLKLGDEIYQHKSPFYDRSKLHILVSLDLSDPNTKGTKGQKRADNDYAVSWIRPYGQGRVFYTSFAHDARAWNDPQRNAHIFAGLAYCLGDLKANDKPCVAAWDTLTAEEKVTRLGAFAIRGDAASLAAHLDDADMDVARAATLGLGRVGGSEALARLIQLVEKPGADLSLADARQTALGAALARTAETDLPLAATYAKTAYGLPTATDMLRAAAAKVLVTANSDFFPTALADASKFVVQAALCAGDKVPAETLVKVLAEMKDPQMKVVLLKRLVANKATAASAAIAACTKDENETVAAAAVEALAALGCADGAEAILAARARGGKVQQAADVALAEMGGIGPAVFALAAQDVSVLKVAGERAETQLVAGWKPFLASDDAKVRKAAWRAFGRMTSVAVLPQAAAWFGQIKDDEKDQATTALWHVLKELDGATRDALLLNAWKNGSPAARAAASELVYRSRSFDAFDFWEKLAADTASAAAAKKEYVALADRVLNDLEKGGTELNRTNWKASATRGGGNAGKAIDGDRATRWTTEGEAKDAAFILDLGGNFFVTDVTLDTSDSPRDTPAGCDVYASFDGQSWKGPVASCDDKSEKTTTFKLGTAARHLKFVAQGTRPALWWSIHEIEVKAETDKSLVQKIRATADKFRTEVK